MTDFAFVATRDMSAAKHVAIGERKVLRRRLDAELPDLDLNRLRGVFSGGAGLRIDHVGCQRRYVALLRLLHTSQPGMRLCARDLAADVRRSGTLSGAWSLTEGKAQVTSGRCVTPLFDADGPPAKAHSNCIQNGFAIAATHFEKAL